MRDRVFECGGDVPGWDITLSFVFGWPGARTLSFVFGWPGHNKAVSVFQLFMSEGHIRPRNACDCV